MESDVYVVGIWTDTQRPSSAPNILTPIRPRGPRAAGGAQRPAGEAFAFKGMFGIYSLRPVLSVSGIHVRRPRQTYKNSTDDSDLCSLSLCFSRKTINNASSWTNEWMKTVGGGMPDRVTERLQARRRCEAHLQSPRRQLIRDILLSLERQIIRDGGSIS